MIPNLQAYQYDGPEEFHAVVGQIMPISAMPEAMNRCPSGPKSCCGMWQAGIN